MPVVSVIIPIYNIAPYLPQCLDSVCGQTLKDIEIICVDDGSDDGSAEIAASYGKKDGRVCVHRQMHQGVGASRNQGIAHARGTYMIFVDGDDWIEVNMLEQMVAEAEKNCADVAVCSASVHCETSSAGIRRKAAALQNVLTAEPGVWTEKDGITGAQPEDDRRRARWTLLERPGSWPFIWNKLMRSRILKENQLTFSCGLPLGEDGIFLQTLYQYVDKVVFVKSAFYHYRYQRRDSATVRLQQNDSLRVMNHWKVIEELLVSWKERGLIKENEMDLLQWIVKFFYGDFIDLPAEERSVLSRKLFCLARDCQLLEFGEQMKGRLGKRFRYMLNGAANCSNMRRLTDIVWYKFQEHIDAAMHR